MVDQVDELAWSQLENDKSCVCGESLEACVKRVLSFLLFPIFLTLLRDISRTYRSNLEVSNKAGSPVSAQNAGRFGLRFAIVSVPLNADQGDN